MQLDNAAAVINEIVFELGAKIEIDSNGVSIIYKDDTKYLYDTMGYAYDERMLFKIYRHWLRWDAIHELRSEMK